jgi:hypothetical protein
VLAVEIVAWNLIARRRLDADEIRDCLRKVAAGRRLLGEFESPKEHVRAQPENEGLIFDSGVAIGLVRRSRSGDHHFTAVARGGREIGNYSSHRDAELAVRRSTNMRWRCDGMLLPA